MQYEEDDSEFTKNFMKDMEAFEFKYPDAHLVIEIDDNTDGRFRVEHGQMELFFDKYEDIVKYLKIYD
jgi:hypothetical protein